MRKLKDDERVVVAMNTKGVLTIQDFDPKRHGPDAKTYGDGDGAECYAAIVAAAASTGAEINRYAVWKPEVSGLADADRTAELVKGRYHQPKIILGDPNYTPRGRSRGFTQTF